MLKTQHLTISRHVLINEIGKSSFIKDINDEEYTRHIKHPTKEMIEIIVASKLHSLNKKINDFLLVFGSVNALGIDDNFNVSGEGRVLLISKEGTSKYVSVLEYENFDQLDKVLISIMKI